MGAASCKPSSSRSRLVHYVVLSLATVLIHMHVAYRTPSRALSAVQLTNMPYTAVPTFASFAAPTVCDAGMVPVGVPPRCRRASHVAARQGVYVGGVYPRVHLYCNVPKTGCTYHMAIVRRANGSRDYEKQPHLNKETLALDALDDVQIARIVTDARVPKYMVVRNPIMRTLSAYISKMQRKKKNPLDFSAREFRKWVRVEFADMSARGLESMNSHWRPQVEGCGLRKESGLGQYFRQFRFEQPRGYVDYLEANLNGLVRDGWDGARNLSFREFVLSPHDRTGGTERWFSYFFDVETFDFLADRLRDDITMLGYQQQVNGLRELLIAGA